MTELLTAAQMRAIEQAAIKSGKVTGLELMERAGQGVVDAIFAEWPELAVSPAAGGGRGPAPSADASPPGYFGQDDDGVRRAVVLCGPGNNGGDGFVVARLLKEAGWEVDVFLYGDAGKLPPDARVNYERWKGRGSVQALSDFDAWDQRYALGVDAVFGTGLTRPIDDAVLNKMRDLGAIDRTVALDTVSGLCADSGCALQPVDGDAYPYFTDAQLCVTFHAMKLGHLLGETPTRVRKLVVVDIGLNRRDALRHLGFLPSKDGKRRPDHSIVVKMPKWETYNAAFMNGDSILDKSQGHKYTHGHALILSGGVGRGGAARLAARGALRIGAGAVTVGAPPAALIENAAQLNAVMLAKVKDAGDLSDALSDKRINALCVGPGLGLGAREEALLAAALGATGEARGLVLDADALTLLARNPALFAQLHDGCVLTPHAGEFARLFPDIAEKRLFPDIAEKLSAPAVKGPAYSKVDATREAAARAGCVVLFKGPDTVIAAPDGRCSINASVYERAAPWLATAGSGDVLAGFITGLLARGFAPMQAAESGAWLHTECALSFGPGLIAEDLPEELPKVLRKLFDDEDPSYANP